MIYYYKYYLALNLNNIDYFINIFEILYIKNRKVIEMLVYYFSHLKEIYYIIQ